MRNLFVLIVLLHLYAKAFAETSKRLLTNDPDILSERITKLETMIQQLTSENQEMKSKSNQQSQKIDNLQNLLSQHDTGSTYVRWARKQCPNNGSELVYSGYAGGGYYDHSGAAAEPVCLPPDPDFGKTSASQRGMMYGAEFDDNFFHPSGNAEDVPCAVCRVNRASSVLMIPGKNSCYPGWNKEYDGYLASNHYSHAAAGSFVCIDIQPEFLTGGGTNDNGKLFQSVIAKCGALQCPPYKNNYPLTCVVCSK